MNKTAIKNFAVWARKKLISDITYKAGMLGITDDAKPADPLPQSAKDLQFFDIGTKDYAKVAGEEIDQRNAFVSALNKKEDDIGSYKKAFDYIVEEVAYTWFNRLIAVRFMEVNDYLPSGVRVLSSENGAKAEPDFVTNPFETDMDFSESEQERIIQLKDENRLDELFRMLFIKQCNKLHEILPELFETTNDYTELLLNISFTDNDGVVSHLIHDINEDDFNVDKEGQVEIIGWLYQYYNTEPKDMVFANLKKNIKISKENIPAATQLFTPDWIVRYMVENSLGRLWLEGHPDDNLKSKWKYYLDEAEQEAEVERQLEEIRAEYRNISPEDIKIIDPCMGSGHILVYAFEVLMQIYESRGYTQRDAAKSILINNIYGLEIDRRAYQLAYFAVMMKARQYNRRILNAEIKPNLFTAQGKKLIDKHLIDFIAGGNDEIKEDLETICADLKDFEEYGSIINVTPVDFERIYDRIDEIKSNFYSDIIGQVNQADTIERALPFINKAQTIARKYDVVCTNPPYMGGSRMNGELADHIKQYYPDSKSDLFSTFIERCGQLTKQHSYYAMITQHAWMFLSSYEKLREKLMQKTIINMAHLGARAFDEIGGEVVQTTAFVNYNSSVEDYKGTYARLVDVTGENEKRDLFLQKEKIYIAKQENFSKIPGSPVAYWVSENAINNFSVMKQIGNYGEGRIGLITGDTGRFIRYWFEVATNKIGFGIKCNDESITSKLRWFPIQNGGSFRRWYGNLDSVVNWENDGYEMKYDNYFGKRVRSHNYNGEFAFQEAISWTTISSGTFCCRYAENGFIFDTAGPFFCPNNTVDLFAILAFLESKIANMYLTIMNPTINFPPGYIQALPFSNDCLTGEISQLSKNNIYISRVDWDAFETSWDFKVHPLVPLSQEKQAQENSQFQKNRMEKFGRLSWHYEKWAQECEDRFNQLKSNEEELNRIFIDIYGLQDELTPKVEDKDVTVRKADLQRDIRSFVSYAVGCMFGRYSLDTEGFAYAGGEWDTGRYSTFMPVKDNCIIITDEDYFEDDIASRFEKFVKTVYGEATLEENLAFIADALGNKGNTSRAVIRNYFLNDFIKDHIKIYKKRPIYWLYDSGKQNAFKALVYMHRYNADTTGNVRVEYLHRIQTVYERELERMQYMIDNSSDSRDVSKAIKRKEKLHKQLKETKEYDDNIAHLALSRIEIDLDDGVKVNYEKVQTAPDGTKLQILTKI